LLRPSSREVPPIRSGGDDPAGVNVLGFIDFDQSLGHVARQIIAAFEEAGVPVAALNHDRSMESARTTAHPPPVARFHTNVVVVTADQFEFVVADHGPTLLDGRRTIAYWFWELDYVPDWMVRAAEHVDEIWVASRFTADALGRVLAKPVRHVPIRIPRPEPSAKTREDFGISPDRFVFLTTFDQFSVPERKNPFGVIAAFTRAFTDGQGPLLWIKTTNGQRGWINHERLLLAAAGRSDVIVWDEHLTRADQMAVVDAADCLVSLHRSEGLGLHCAEAMWLGKPVIATRYSGNLDFMDDSVSLLVDPHLVPVLHGQGIYPAGASWADPDLDQAAEWMRRLVADPALGAGIGARARQRMENQPPRAEFGRMMAKLANLYTSVSG
jgi:glycosyltransferase involved in cell wall biosynthesis